MVNKLPEGWQELTLEQLTKNMVDGPFGSDLKKVHYTENREARIIQLSNIGEDGWKDDNVKYTTFTHANKLKRCIVAYPNVVVAKMMPAGRAMLCPDKEAMYILSSDAVKIVVDEEIIMPEYFVYATKALFFQEQIDNDTQGSTRQRTSIKKLRKNRLLVPQLAEQKKIVRVLSDIDALIANLELQVEKNRNLKQACLAHLFPKIGQNEPDVRLPGFSDEWNIKKLSEVVSFSKGKGYSKADVISWGTPIILYGRLYTSYQTYIGSIDTYALEKVDSVYSRGGEVIIPASGETEEEIARAAVVENKGVLLGGDMNILHPYSMLKSGFLALEITYGASHKVIAKKAQGKTVVHIHNSDLQDIEIRYPSVTEQEAICNIFRDVDYQIEKCESELQKYRAIKQGMMEQLLTGKIRL